MPQLLEETWMCRSSLQMPQRHQDRSTWVIHEQSYQVDVTGQENWPWDSWVPKYIRCTGSLTFLKLGPMLPRMTALAASQDLIGWRNFMEGRISTHFFSIQQAHLSNMLVRMNASGWTKKLITKILHMSHAQWLLRNFMLHDHRSQHRISFGQEM